MRFVAGGGDRNEREGAVGCQDEDVWVGGAGGEVLPVAAAEVEPDGAGGAGGEEGGYERPGGVSGVGEVRGDAGVDAVDVGFFVGGC